LLDEAGVDFLEETRDGSDDGGTDFDESLGDGVDGFDVGESGALKDVDVIERAAIDMGEWKKGERDVFGGIEAEIMADVVDVRAEVAMREHNALRLAGGAGGVDEGSELAGKNLGSAQTVRGNVCRACCGDERFVAETFGGDVRATVGDDNLFKLREAGADVEKPMQLRRANCENDFRAAMFEDVGHAVGRFVEVDGNGDGASAVDGEIGGVPLRTIGGKKTDAVAGLHAEFDKRGGKASDAAEKFLGRNGFPAAVAANHLGAWVRMSIDSVQEPRWKRAVVHGLSVTVPYPFGWRNEAMDCHFR